jgi:hypothetical protein
MRPPPAPIGMVSGRPPGKLCVDLEVGRVRDVRADLAVAPSAAADRPGLAVVDAGRSGQCRGHTLRPWMPGRAVLKDHSDLRLAG